MTTVYNMMIVLVTIAFLVGFLPIDNI